MRRAVLAFVLAVSCVLFCDAQSPRALQPADVSRLERFGEAVFSPDGKWLAYGVVRSREAAAHQLRYFVLGGDRADIWIKPVAGGQPINITRGAEDKSGSWSPIWSPDSERLALISTKSGLTQLWLWERATGQLRRITERSVNGAALGQPQPVAWINARQLVCAVMPAGAMIPGMTVTTQSAERAMREWPKAWSGAGTTVSVLQSGVPSSYLSEPQGELLLIDVVTNTSRRLASGNFERLIASPDARFVAAMRQVDVSIPDSRRALRYPQDLAGTRYSVTVASIENNGEAPTLSAVYEAVPGSVAWSPDGKYIAFTGLPEPGSAARLFKYDVASKTIEAQAADKIEPIGDGYRSPAGVIWSASGKLLVRAKPLQKSRNGSGDRSDWWMLEAQPRNTTGSMALPPDRLFRLADGDSFVGFAGGKLWRVGPESVQTLNLTAGGGSVPNLSSLVWPEESGSRLEANQRMVLRVRQKDASDYYWVRLESQSGTAGLERVPAPSPQAEPAAYSAAGESFAFTEETPGGTVMRLSTPDRTTTVAELNAFLREVSSTRYQHIPYRSVEGEDLHGWLVLPEGYQKGKRYPLIVEVYPGLVYRDYLPATFTATKPYGSEQLLAAHGFAVFLPSMPLPPFGAVIDTYMELTKGVLPGIDKLIEMGIADPQKLGVIGHSYGGYGVYGLVTQTKRFRAAASLAGLSDWLSLYSAMDARVRYEDSAHDRLFYMSHSEAGGFRFGVPPWKDINRYIRNSPITYVDKVETPLLIIQGDMDSSPIQQGEEFFMSLYRQNKRAEFVRYWGEEHVISSPPNFLDMWKRIYAWFDQFLRADDAAH